MTPLEQKIFDAVPGISIQGAKEAAKVALDLAYDAYKQGCSDSAEYYHGRGNGTFKQFIEDYE